MRVTDLAAAANLDVSTVSRHVAQLERTGLIARTPDPDDRRAQLVGITDDGRSTCSTKPSNAGRALLESALAGGQPDDIPSSSDLLGSSCSASTRNLSNGARMTKHVHRAAARLDRGRADYVDPAGLAAGQGAPGRTPRPPICSSRPSGDYLSHRQILVVMGGLMAGMFLAALDQSIVGVALPKITSELGGLDKLSWVVTAYLLTSTAATPLWGKISDLRGRRPIFQAAIVVFLIGSIICGFSPRSRR